MLMLGTTAKKASYSKNPPQDYIFYSVRRETKCTKLPLTRSTKGSWLALVGYNFFYIYSTNKNTFISTLTDK